MKSLHIVHIGGIARRFDGYSLPRNYQVLYDDIAKLVQEVHIFTGVYEPTDDNYDFVNEIPLARENIRFTMFRNNHPGTSSIEFVRNYAVAVGRLVKFLRTAETVHILLPSAIATVAACFCLVFRIPYSCYIGGNWSEESKHRPRNTLVRQIMYPVNRFLIDAIIGTVVSRAKFVLVSGYDRFAELSARNVHVQLTVPLLELQEDDVFVREDTCTTYDIRLLYVGLLRETKGVQNVVQVLSTLRRIDPERNYSLSIVGTGSFRQELERLVERLGLAESVRFHGHIAHGEKLLNLYRSADMFLFLSRSEGFPRVLYEASSQSLPIICSNVGGIPYFFRHRLHCMMVDPENVDEASVLVRELAHDTALRSAMISAARTHVLENVIQRRKAWGSAAAQIIGMFQGRVVRMAPNTGLAE